MKIFVKIASIALCVLAVSFSANAQREKAVSGTYTYVQPNDESQKVAESKAIQQARIEAIAAEFGTLVEQTNLTNISDGNVKFHSLGLSEVRGEWIRDRKEPKFEYAMDPKTGERIITVTVWGDAREIVTTKIDVKAYVLRNSTDKRQVDDKFYIGDQYYVAFKTPVNGYVAIYIMDENGDATRLLPYPLSQKKSYPVKADKDYIFFSYNHQNEVDEYNEMVEYRFGETNKAVEYNRMYIFFSPTEFTLPGDTRGMEQKEGTTDMVPPMVDYATMQKWIGKVRSRDKKMQVEQRELKIYANQH